MVCGHTSPCTPKRTRHLVFVEFLIIDDQMDPLRGISAKAFSTRLRFFKGKRPDGSPASVRPEYPRIVEERIRCDLAFERSAASSHP